MSTFGSCTLIGALISQVIQDTGAMRNVSIVLPLREAGQLGRCPQIPVDLPYGRRIKLGSTLFKKERKRASES